MEAISRWLVLEIREQMNEIQTHIITNAADALSRIRSFRFEPGDKLIKLDMKDFYYSGSAEQLISDVLRMWDPRDKRNRLRRQAMELLLHNQLVRGKCWPPEGEGCFRVLTGSGMGLIHSGDIADCAFLMLVENWLNHPDVRQGFGVRGYVRFRDDALLVCNSSRMQQLIKILKAKARYFNIIVERISSEAVHFLEFCIYVNPDRGRLQAEYIFKDRPTIPLATTSMHNMCVHRGWPRMVVKNIIKYSETRREGLEEVAEYKERLRASFTTIQKTERSKCRETASTTG